MPVPGSKLPSGAGVQDALPGVELKLPAAHGVGAMLPVPESKLPAGADTQAALPGVPL